MTYIAVSPELIEVGKPTKKEIFEKLVNNDNDFNVRLNTLESSFPARPIMKLFVLNASSFSTATGINYYEADFNFSVTGAYIRIFEKGSLTGTFEIDIKKSTTDLNGPSFISIFSTKPSINLATASNYAQSTNQIFDVGKININTGDFLRLDITQFPTNGVMSKFLVTLFGE